MKERFKDTMKQYFAPLSWLVAAVFLLEEAIWNWTAKKMALLGNLPAIAYLESKVHALPPYPALAVFLLPDVFIVPAKILGMHFFASGYVILGVIVILIAKVSGMALFAYIFGLTKPALMQLGWFKKLHDWIVHYSDRIHAYLDGWEAYQVMKSKVRSTVATVKAWFKAQPVEKVKVTVHRVYWTAHGRPQFKDFQDIVEMLKFCEAQRRLKDTSFIVSSSEIAECTNLKGVAAPSADYNWEKRRGGRR